jgi:hypothetical protein
MRDARPFLLLVSLLFIYSLGAVATSEKPSLVIPLESEGAPKELFVSKPGITCLHGFRGWTGLFWLTVDRIAVAFTTEKPCNKEAGTSSNTVRVVVFNLNGKKVASQDWKVEERFVVVRGPVGTLVVSRGNKVQFFDPELHEVESGQFDALPSALFETPFGRTLPVLTDKGNIVEFYSIQPLKLVSTLSRQSLPRASELDIEAAGDERAAAAACSGRTALSCNRIQVLVPEANFALPNGQPWAYEEPGKKVDLDPIGFLSDGELLIHRDAFFSSGEVLLSKSDGSATPLPQAKGLPRPVRMVGVAPGGKRFSLEAGGDPTVSNNYAKHFVVADVDKPKALLEKIGSAFGGAGGMSPDGKWFAFMDKAELRLYPLP